MTENKVRMLRDYLSDTKQFERWLAERAKDGDIFKRQESDACPLACYIRNKLGIGPISVGSNSMVLSNGETVRFSALPAFVARFVSLVDEGAEDDYDANIFADEALHILRDILAENSNASA